MISRQPPVWLMPGFAVVNVVQLDGIDAHASNVTAGGPLHGAKPTCGVEISNEIGGRLHSLVLSYDPAAGRYDSANSLLSDDDGLHWVAESFRVRASLAAAKMTDGQAADVVTRLNDEVIVMQSITSGGVRMLAFADGTRMFGVVEGQSSVSVAETGFRTVDFGSLAGVNCVDGGYRLS